MGFIAVVATSRIRSELTIQLVVASTKSGPDRCIRGGPACYIRHNNDASDTTALPRQQFREGIPNRNSRWGPNGLPCNSDRSPTTAPTQTVYRDCI